jgi:hypothetical protein
MGKMNIHLEIDALDRRDFLKVWPPLLIGQKAAFLFQSSSGVQKNEGIKPMANQEATEDRLVVLWTSGDRDVALKMVFMYTFNAKLNGWWKDICLIIWGPSAKLLAVDIELQDYIKKMKDAGVELRACIACADSYGVSETLRKLGVTVEGMGKPLTQMLKEGQKVITF